MSKKMFFIDLDGTTLRDDKSVPEENIQAIRDAVDAGHYVAITTGRALSSAGAVAEQLQMMRKGCFLISYNGGIIYDLSDLSLLQDLRLPDEYARYLFGEAKREKLYMQAYSDTNILSGYECPELEFYSSKTSMKYTIVPELYDLETYHTPKVLLVSHEDHGILRKFQQDHLEWEKGKCISFFSCPEYLEYCPLGGTKADGIAFFEKYLGIAHEDTIAVGDEENDLSMLRYAGVSVAMVNGNPALHPYADYITRLDNNHGGLAEVIRKYAGV